MTAVPFDTLKLSRKLESGGFTQVQANTAAEALAEAMTGAELATKSDLRGAASDLRNEIHLVRTDVDSFRAELKAEIELSKRDLTIRIGSMFVVAVGVMLAAMRFLL